MRDRGGDICPQKPEFGIKLELDLGRWWCLQVKAGSPTESMCTLALAAMAALAALGTRPWFDHVPSADNPADPLSRGGLQDEDVARMIADGRYVVHEAVPPPERSMLDYEFWWQQQCDAE